MIFLEDDAERGIQLFMAEYAVSRDEAFRLIVRDWLAGHGYLPQNDEDDLRGNSNIDGGAEAMIGGA